MKDISGLVRLAFLVLLLVGGLVVSIGLHLKKKKAGREAKRMGIVYCPRCDGALVQKTDSGYRCESCDHLFPDNSHVPEPLG